MDSRFNELSRPRAPTLRLRHLGHAARIGRYRRRHHRPTCRHRPDDQPLCAHRARELEASVERLKQNHINIKGVVLNGMKREANNSYDYYALRCLPFR